MSDKDNLVINAGVYIFSSTFDTIHEFIIIRNISKIISFLCKYLSINFPLLNNTVGYCLKKICEKFGGLIIGDKSVFVTSCYLFSKLFSKTHLPEHWLQRNSAKWDLHLFGWERYNGIEIPDLEPAH